MDQHATISLDELRKGLTAYHDSFDEHSDSYINMATGLGLPGTSKSEATYFGRERLLQPTELQNLYLSNAYATRIVDRMVDDATRVDWTLTGVDKRFDWSSVKSQLDDLGALMLIGDAWRWARLFGGGLVVMAVDDGQPYDKPLDLNAARRVRGLTTVDSSCVLVQGYVAGVGSVAWSKPSGYQVISPWVFGAGGTGQLAASNKPIHPSRVIRFDGCRVPAGLMVNNGGWSPSVLQRCKKQLDAYGSAYAYAQEILHDLSVMLVKLTGFQEMLLGDNGVADAREMLRQLRWGIDNLNLLVIDKDASEYQEIKRSVEGLEKMLAAFERDLVGASGMTRLILVGEQASGLGASSSDEVRAWYDSVGKEQKFSVTPAINRLLEVIFAIRRNNGEQVPTEWEIKFAPLWTPEPKARAEIAQLWMNTASTGIMSGMLTPDEGKAMLVYNGVLEDLPEASTAVGADPEPDDLENVVPVEGAQEPAANGPPAEPEAAPVAEQALNGAQVQSLVEILAQVSAGTLAPLAAEWVIGQAVPSAVSSPARLAQTKAAVASAAAQKPAPPPAEPGTAPAPTAPVAPTDEDEPEDEEHPVDVAWSNDPLPADAMTAKEIAVTLGVKTGRVTRLVREGRLRQWNVLGKKVISLRDVRAIILEDNQADAALIRAARDAAPADLATVYRWLREHYSMAPKLTRPRIEALIALRDTFTFLRAPDVEHIYRGLHSVKPGTVGRLVGETNPTRDKSWTTDFRMACRYAAGEFVAEGEVDPDGIGVVLVAVADPAILLLNAKAIAEIPEVAQYMNPIWGETLESAIRSEAEVVACGPLQVVQVRAVDMSGVVIDKLAQDEADE